jgi:hypothetical protein
MDWTDPSVTWGSVERITREPGDGASPGRHADVTTSQVVQAPGS